MLFDTSATALLVCNVAKPKGAKVVDDDDAGVVCFGAAGACACTVPAGFDKGTVSQISGSKAECEV